MSIWKGLFWKDAAERVISTAAQAALAVITAEQFTVVNFDWESGLTVVGVAALAALLKTIVANQTVDGSVSPASLVK